MKALLFTLLLGFGVTGLRGGDYEPIAVDRTESNALQAQQAADARNRKIVAAIEAQTQAIKEAAAKKEAADAEQARKDKIAKMIADNKARQEKRAEERRHKEALKASRDTQSAIRDAEFELRINGLYQGQ